jgi:cytochrome c-type biogenesis protein CcmH
MSQAEQGQPRDAIATWQKVLPLISDDQKSTSQVQEMIAQTERQLGIEPGSADSVLPPQADASAPAAQPAAATQPAVGGKAAVTVEVSLDPALAASAAPGDAVFIYAKATQGPPMPLAAVRKKVSDLPLTITLDDSMAMMPAMRLSAFPQVTVGARVSKSGNAISQPGDLIGEVSPVASKGADPVSISIASRVP